MKSKLAALTINLGLFCAVGQTQYDLLLQGGHVIDAKNHVSAVRDVAIRDGKIAAVAEHIDPATALKTGFVSVPSDQPLSSVWASCVATMLAKATERACGRPEPSMMR